MGGGTPLIEANRVGCDVLGFDINPMAAWIVREEIEHLDLDAYRAAADRLLVSLERELGALYRTDCPHYGDKDVPVKYFLWVKVHRLRTSAASRSTCSPAISSRTTPAIRRTCWSATPAATSTRSPT